MKRIVVRAAMLCALLTGIFAGGSSEEAIQVEEVKASSPKYVFMFIGDGMSMTQINAAEAYLSTKNNNPTMSTKLNFSKFPDQGLTTTFANDRFITGSAAAATAIATGKKTNIGVLSMDPAKQNNYKTIAEQASEAGMKVGIISSVDLDHATPAAFYAHQASRSNYYEIGVEAAHSSVNYFGGGNFRLGKTPEGQPTVHEIMADEGWVMAGDKDDFNALTPAEKVYAYSKGFAGDALPYDLDREENEISLAEFTAKGIELLDNEKGFFIMVESGKIDWACHANDAASSIHDTIAFADSIQEAINFYNDHKEETLIVVTGDHETGGLTIGFAGTKYETAFAEIGKQTKSYEYFDEFVLGDYLAAGNKSVDGLLPAIEECFGLTDFSEYEAKLLAQAYTQSLAGDDVLTSKEENFLLYGGYEPLTMQLTHIVDNRAGLAWTSCKHTGVPVPTFALGLGADMFNGYYDNTDIYKKTAAIMGFEFANDEDLTMAK